MPPVGKRNRSKHAQIIHSVRLELAFNTACQHLVDTAPIEIDDLEPPAQGLDGFTWARQMLEFADDETRHGLIVAAWRQNDPELLGHFVGWHPPGQEPGAV